MPLRALRLLHLLSNTEATALAAPLSFATTLQLAAGRAWTQHVAARAPLQNAGTRRIHTTRACQMTGERTDLAQAGPSTITRHDSNKPSKKSSQSANPAEPQAQTGFDRAFATPSKMATYLDPIPSDAELDKFASESYDKPPRKAWRRKMPLRPRPPPHFPPPHTPQDLHRNLLELVTCVKPPPRLPMLLDYHDYYPEFQSTSSYNLLIYLSIRHSNYGTARRLFSEHAEKNLPRNMESFQLEVRSLVQQGLWDQAWKYVQVLKNEGQLPGTGHDETGIPLPLWLEFCRPIRKHRWKARSVYDESGKILNIIMERVTETSAEVKGRQMLLNQNRPRETPHLALTAPYAVYCIVQLLLRSGDHQRALELTKAFFTAIPRRLKRSYIRRCLEIIHVHMLFCPAKDGLPRFYQLRRTLISLLKLHRALRPNSRTMYLLLAPLQRSRKCGTVAWKVLQTAKSEWGPSVEDRRVQRRVIQFALKEGRKDIVKRLLLLESTQRYSRQRRLDDAQYATRITQPILESYSQVPLQLIYAKKGWEARLWYRVRAKIYQQNPRHSPKYVRIKTRISILRRPRKNARQRY